MVGEVRVRDVRLDPLLDLLDRGLMGTGMGGTGRSVVRRVGGAESWKMEKNLTRGARGATRARGVGAKVRTLFFFSASASALLGSLKGPAMI